MLSLAQRRPVVVVTKMDRVRVLRQFPYLRRQPDLSDAESALSGRKLDDTLLKEPALWDVSPVEVRVLFGA